MGDAIQAPTHPQPSGRLLTIGIPVFNGKSLLRNCLQSVIDSTLPRDRFEILIADDGSSEPETFAILKEFEQELAGDPGFFRVIYSETNSGGAARPRNRIIEQATGDYIFFIDSDDTIGDQALERIADALAEAPADWIALHQVPVNGRAGVCTVRKAHVEVRRAKALGTLTVHKVFRRAEIERQQLWFDEGLPSGQDIAFAFSYLLNAKRFLMLGAYDYYFLMQHAENPDEPTHLSRRANTPERRIEKNERILRSMLTALRDSDLPEAERQEIVSQIALPRVLVRQGYLKNIVAAGPDTGTRALRRLSILLADRLVTDIDPAEVKELTPEHLAAIADADWGALARLVGRAALRTRAAQRSKARAVIIARWVRRWHRLVGLLGDRERLRQAVSDRTLLRRPVEQLRGKTVRPEADGAKDASRPESGARI